MTPELPDRDERARAEALDAALDQGAQAQRRPGPRPRPTILPISQPGCGRRCCLYLSCPAGDARRCGQQP